MGGSNAGADEQDEDEIEYGKWIEHTAEEALAEARKAVPQVKEIWPHWNNGVPTKLRLYLHSPTFSTGTAYHHMRGIFDTVEQMLRPGQNWYIVYRLGGHWQKLV